jgi:ferredoxin
MSEIHNLARRILEEKLVDIVIGFTEAKGGRAKPCFVTEPAAVDKMIFNENCVNNLAVYLHKEELHKYRKIGIFGGIPTVRAILQLASENQLEDGNVTAIIPQPDGTAILIDTFAEMEIYVKENFQKGTKELDSINSLLQMPLEDRWNYWVSTLSDCVKCYACRSACPLCYCERCTVECNQPQWVPIASHGQGNMEWHILRAMHLAGRCIGCNECARACPADLPVNLLTARLTDELDNMFGQIPGMSAKQNFALSNFKVEDKEEFIR